MGIDFEVDGKRARSASEYEAFLRDKKKIDAIKKNINLESQRGIEKVYSSICTGSIRFESRYGFEFEDEITALYIEQKNKSNKNLKADKRNQKSFDKTGDKKNDEEKVEFNDQSVDIELVEYYKNKIRFRKIFLKYAAIAGCLLVFGFSIFYVIKKINDNKSSDSTVKEIIQASKDNAFVFTTIKPSYNDTVTYDEYQTPEVLEKYKNAKETNDDMVGWICIADTNINYPVVQTENNDYYLSHGFDKKADANGCIFADMYCSIYPRSKNIILYGHHMKSGRMFANIEKYDSYDFYTNHRTFTFDTIYEEAEYEVAFVFRDYVHASDDTGFKYYEFVDVNSETEFVSYITELTEKSIYDTGVSVDYNDDLLTLSTCDYKQANGRFVIIAKKINK